MIPPPSGPMPALRWAVGTGPGRIRALHGAGRRRCRVPAAAVAACGAGEETTETMTPPTMRRSTSGRRGTRPARTSGALTPPDATTARSAARKTSAPPSSHGAAPNASSPAALDVERCRPAGTCVPVPKVPCTWWWRLDSIPTTTMSGSRRATRRRREPGLIHITPVAARKGARRRGLRDHAAQGVGIAGREDVRATSRSRSIACARAPYRDRRRPAQEPGPEIMGCAMSSAPNPRTVLAIR